MNLKRWLIGVFIFLCFIFFLILVFPATGSKKNSTKKIVIACAGDSLMRPVPFYLRRLLPAKKVIIKEWAQGGLSAATYPSFFEAHPQWRRQKVDIILLQLGTNDVILFGKKEEDENLFKTNLKKIIREMKKLDGNCFRRPQIIIATAPPFSGNEGEVEKNRLLEGIINPTIRKLAEEEKLLLVDHWPKFKGQKDLYEPDGVHPNREGEKVIARNWRRAIRLCCFNQKQIPQKFSEKRIFD
ncbi:MAG: GDSL-type esterase/lipase family protein [Candidatus Aminicenantes bacterium]|nr:GDSL-type esterase/lipase family protein [Candidatus Aminicenantes bacterium]